MSAVQLKSLQFSHAVDSAVNLDYLDEFIKRAELPLSEATSLKDNEKANLLLTMLTPEVKEALQGQSALTNPAHPQLVYDMLRTKFPASESQLVIALGKLRMDESDKAQDYLNSVQRQYVIHQIVLPHTFKEIMDIYIATCPTFVQYCSMQVEMRRNHIMSVGKDVKSIVWSWDDLLKWGRDYDVQRDLMIGVKARHSTRWCSVCTFHEDTNWTEHQCQYC